MIKQFQSRQFLAFLITGGIAASINFGSRILYSLWIDFSSAIVFSYITGMITAFALAKLFVFKDSQQPLHHAVFYFLLVNVIAILQTWLISMGLAYYVLPAMGFNRYLNEIAHAFGVTVPVFTSYMGHKHLSFR